MFRLFTAQEAGRTGCENKPVLETRMKYDGLDKESFLACLACFLGTVPVLLLRKIFEDESRDTEKPQSRIRISEEHELQCSEDRG